MSYLDLLPEEPIPLPDTGLSSLQKKGICLTQHVCARCGETFFLRWGATGYRRSVRGEKLMFCTWKCLREDEKTREMPKRGRAAKDANARIAEIEKKNAEDFALLESRQAQSMSSQEKKRIKGRISARMKRLKEIKGEDGEAQ